MQRRSGSSRNRKVQKCSSSRNGKVKQCGSSGAGKVQKLSKKSARVQQHQPRTVRLHNSGESVTAVLDELLGVTVLHDAAQDQPDAVQLVHHPDVLVCTPTSRQIFHTKASFKHKYFIPKLHSSTNLSFQNFIKALFRPRGVGYCDSRQDNWTQQ